MSRLQIKALRYKAMQMRSGLHDRSLPLTSINREHDTVFLWVQSRRKRDELCREDHAEVAWRLNTAAYWPGLADANYIWLLLPAGSVSQAPACFQTFSHSDSLEPGLTTTSPIDVRKAAAFILCEHHVNTEYVKFVYVRWTTVPYLYHSPAISTR